MAPSARMEALELLTTLRPVSEKVLGEQHMQTIAIMNTQARVLFHLCRFFEAEELMAQAMARIQLSGFHDCHPFHLEAKRRHGIFLEAAGKNRFGDKQPDPGGPWQSPSARSETSILQEQHL